ncbi:MAG: hypothetical protein DRI34_04030 [Deltaproteobacteria bacterium]|nr:MAG: hypothetical protein DRI34_04030 [Deltaproteobacteria bacterium]
MFNIGTWELIVILALALLLLGPQKLPEVARSLGKGLLQLRRSLDEVKQEIDIEGIKRDIVSDVGVDELRRTLDIRADVRRALDELEAEPAPVAGLEPGKQPGPESPVPPAGDDSPGPEEGPAG